MASKRLFLGSHGVGALPDFVGDPKGMLMEFVPTAANVVDERSWLDEERVRLVEMGFEVVDLDLDAVGPEEIVRRVAVADLLFVAGGNLYHLLQRELETGFADALRSRVDSGRPYAGTSSGATIMGPDPTQVSFSDPSLAPGLTSTQGLGIVDFEIFPHFDWEELAEERLEMIARATVPVVPLRDDQAVIVEGDTYRVVPSP